MSAAPWYRIGGRFRQSMAARDHRFAKRAGFRLAEAADETVHRIG